MRQEWQWWARAAGAFLAFLALAIILSGCAALGNPTPSAGIDKMDENYCAARGKALTACYGVRAFLEWVRNWDRLGER